MADLDDRSDEGSVSLGSQDTLLTICEDSIDPPAQPRDQTEDVDPTREFTSRGQSSPCRIFMYTQNNYNDACFEHYQQLVSSGIAKGFVVGIETGSRTGTPHLQCVVRWKQPKRKHASIRLLRVSCADGDKIAGFVQAVKFPKQAITYCKKDGDFVIYGEPGESQGKREDLESATASFLDHRNLDRFKREFPVLYVKYPKGFSSLLTYPMRKLNEPPEIIWIYGDTGTFKTRCIWESVSDPYKIWPSNTSLQWFDGYNGHPIVLLDDFRAHWGKFSVLLKYTDRYPMRVPSKFGFLNWAPVKIYITCSKSPWAVYDVPSENVSQLVRRCSAIYHTYDSDCPETVVPECHQSWMRAPLRRLPYIPGMPATYFNNSDL